MGVSGAGKTAVGKRLAERQNWPFVDGDDLHPPDNLRKMAAGVPLTDQGQPDAKLVYRRGEPELLRRRLTERRGHFFDPGLLSSQLETLEEPANAVVVDIDADLETVTDRVVAAVGL
jgi:gluconokinase